MSDSLGRALDWLYEHDLTTLFAGLALQARQRFDIEVKQLHVDTTSFSVNGEYLPQKKTGSKGGEASNTGDGSREGEEIPPEPAEERQTSPEEQKSREEGLEAEEMIPIAITHGYSRDHRADLKQWMLALVTTHDGDIPLFLRPLDGNSCDKKSISEAVTDVITHLREAQPSEEERLVVFDSGGYSEANMKRYNEANIRWVSRVPETSKEAKAAVQEETTDWQPLSGACGHYRVCLLDLPQGKERWIIVRTDDGEQAARKQMEKKVKKAQEQWEKKLWHLSKQEVACREDAEAAWKQALKGQPSFLTLSHTICEEKRYQQKGRPKQGSEPDSTIFRIEFTLTVEESEVEKQIKQRASFIVATNVMDEQKLSHEQVYLTYKEQGGVERGFRFLKDPLFLASSVFVKKPERVMALGFLMVLCLLVYRLAEHLLRRQLAATSQTVPNQVNKPTDRPTMRWIFQCFEGIDLLHIRLGDLWQTRVLGLQPLHERVLRLLGPTFCQIYFLSS